MCAHACVVYMRVCVCARARARVRARRVVYMRGGVLLPLWEGGAWWRGGAGVSGPMWCADRPRLEQGRPKAPGHRVGVLCLWGVPKGVLHMCQTPVGLKKVSPGSGFPPEQPQ